MATWLSYIVISIKNDPLDIALTPNPSPRAGEGSVVRVVRVGSNLPHPPPPPTPPHLPRLTPLSPHLVERGWGIEG